MELAEKLKRAEVFLGLENDDLIKIASMPSCREHTYEPGEVIFRSGEEARNVYVLEEGQVDLVLGAPEVPGESDSPRVISTVHKGGFFGWSALVKPHWYVMSAISRKPSRVVTISGKELAALFTSEEHIGYRVLLSLSHIIGARLRYLEEYVATGKRRPFPSKRG